jgi:hypothetical protein
LYVDVGHGGADTVAFVVGNVLRDALVRPGGVVVRLVFGQDGLQVLLAEDQDAVQELAAQGAIAARPARNAAGRRGGAAPRSRAGVPIAQHPSLSRSETSGQEAG